MALTIAVIGPTASGKTKRAVALAEALNGEIISADSRQLYKRMDIGTGKDLGEYGSVPFHLIDICEPGEKYNLHRYLQDFQRAFDDIESRGKMPIICGGTGMYVESALSGMRLPEVPKNQPLRDSLRSYSLPELTEMLAKMKRLHNTTDVDTCQRAIRAIEIATYYTEHPDEALLTDRSTATPMESVIIGVDIPRELRRKRISDRLRQRLDEGMVDEIKALLDEGIEAENLIYYGLEYKYVTLYAIGKITYDAMLHDLEIAIHQFAKRQMTWWRGMERRGFKINWLPYELSLSEFVDQTKSLINARE